MMRRRVLRLLWTHPHLICQVLVRQIQSVFFSRSNQPLAEDFMALSFVLESGRQIPRISRFEGPITVALASSAPPALEGELSRLLTRLRTEAGIAISATAYRTNSPTKITIEALPA